MDCNYMHIELLFLRLQLKKTEAIVANAYLFCAVLNKYFLKAVKFFAFFNTKISSFNIDTRIDFNIYPTRFLENLVK